MAALMAHHAAARKIVMTVDQQLEQLETGRDTSLNLQSEISQSLNALACEVQALEQELHSVGMSERVDPGIFTCKHVGAAQVQGLELLDRESGVWILETRFWGNVSCFVSQVLDD